MNVNYDHKTFTALATGQVYITILNGYFIEKHFEGLYKLLISTFNFGSWHNKDKSAASFCCLGGSTGPVACTINVYDRRFYDHKLRSKLGA
jgi:hypothetical protein